MFWKILLAIFSIFIVMFTLIVIVAVLEAMLKISTEHEPDIYENPDDIF